MTQVVAQQLWKDNSQGGYKLFSTTKNADKLSQKVANVCLTGFPLENATGYVYKE